MSVDDREQRRKKRQSILDKIRALLAKTVENGATEAEAMSAAAKAASMMNDYDLSMDDVDVKESDVKREDFGLDIDMGTFVSMVAMAVARLCGTRYWTDHGGRAATMGTYFGLAHDVEISLYLLEVCQSAMTRELAKYEPIIALARKTVRSARRRSFLNGMAQRLAERINEMADARQRGTGTALVPLKDALIDAAMQDENIKLKSNRARFGDLHVLDLLSGRQAGDLVSLNSAIRGEGDHDMIPPDRLKLEEDAEQEEVG
jgi:hypothetical protein